MIQIYSKIGCKYCVMAKEFLDERLIAYTETHLDDKEEIEMLKKKTNHKTFPFIFQDDEFIGGLKEIMDLYDF